MIPEIAVGAIVAAIIGAMISLAGLIATKENKVSDFRQAWIDNLRNELAAFASNVGLLFDASDVEFTSAKDQFDSLRKETTALNEAYYKIAFRLNLTEDTSAALQAAMIKLIQSPTRESRSTFNSYQGEFISVANKLLKDEWVRVKKGEGAFRRTVLIAISTVVLLFGLMAFVIAGGLTSAKIVDTHASPRSSSFTKQIDPPIEKSFELPSHNHQTIHITKSKE